MCADASAVLFSRENGKTLAEARGELTGAYTRQRLTLELVDELESERTLTDERGRTFITRVPYGVVLSIVPWNTPVGLAFMQIIPALLAGNTVLVKPPESCPLALARAIELMAGAFPPGAVNLITGLPGEIGDHLTRHPGIDKVAFTGSIPLARHIMANAAETIKGITLELGGNDPAVVLADADLGESAMDRMASVVFRMAGNAARYAATTAIASPCSRLGPAPERHELPIDGNANEQFSEGTQFPRLGRDPGIGKSDLQRLDAGGFVIVR